MSDSALAVPAASATSRRAASATDGCAITVEASRHGATQLPSRFLFECGAVRTQRALAA
jgi:hypothetical protein